MVYRWVLTQRVAWPTYRKRIRCPYLVPGVVPHDDDRQPGLDSGSDSGSGPAPAGGRPPAPQVTERDARKVAEAARETEMAQAQLRASTCSWGGCGWG